MNTTPPRPDPATSESENTLERLRKVAKERRKYNQLYPALVRTAKTEGASLRTIGEAAGVHHTSIHQIVTTDLGGDAA